MSPPRTPPAERRPNRSLRHQAQAWFDALKLRIAEVEGAEAIAGLMKDWKRPEDVMRDYPALVPLFLDIVWCSRNTPGFADLFRTESGDVAQHQSEVLALSQKTFDDIIISHLMGTMRLHCERRQNEWLAVERVKRRRGLAKMPLIGAALRKLGLISPIKADVLLADYQHKGLYEALKPFLNRRGQFVLVEALACLPTRTIGLLGPVPAMLDSSDVIRTLASLDTGMVKVAIEMAETFVQAEGTGKEPADYAAPRCAALSGLLSIGTRFLKLAADHRQIARDAITKLVPAVGAGTWALCQELEALRRIAECPAGVALALKELTIEIALPVSVVLVEIADARVATLAINALREATDPATFLSWIREEAYLPAWRQIAHSLSRIPDLPENEPLGPNIKGVIKSTCERGVKVFEEIAEPLQHAA
jgi:hypothetical protein